MLWRRGLLSGHGLREGFYVQDREATILAVKGVLQPPDRVICVPRYVPDPRGGRGREELRYTKVSASEYKLDSPTHRLYAYSDPFLGVDVMAVPLSSIEKVYDPVERLSALLAGEARSEGERAASELAEKLLEHGAAPRLGVSGSILVGLEMEGSDVDLVVYGVEDGTRVRRALRGLLAEGGIRPLDEAALRKTHEECHSEIPLQDFLRQERKRIMKGVFKSALGERRYFVKCVPTTKDLGEEYGDRRYRERGEGLVEGEVVDDTLSFCTPAVYAVKPSSQQGVMRVISYGGSIAEQASLGDVVKAYGRLEEVKACEAVFNQIVVDRVADLFLVLEEKAPC